MRRTRTAVLISGRGSNLAALLAAAREPGYPAEIALVVSNRPDAGGLGHAAGAGVATAIVDHRSHAGKPAFEAALQAVLEAARIELVCLAGFMRLLSEAFVERWRDRMINVHPSLLPSFRGLDTHARAIEAGVRIHGATVHFVRSDVDTGPIIVQGAVPVLSSDTADSLAARVLAVEHRIYPRALALVATGAATVVAEKVVLGAEPEGAEARCLIWPGPA
ncbi:phosphoribosylglycinamide formyltransferase [Faunimonas sp. B44]|uniref:phosphoribosylglycinamide formyltransferase n=1 Tax=Faunimonas sp. B44 TaxID=3461493 RepID=UPI004043BBE5